MVGVVLRNTLKKGGECMQEKSFGELIGLVLVN
jgi:hypothetical protein